MMNNDEFNSWACDIANDYAQARMEMGPDDYMPWEEYAEEAMKAHNVSCVQTVQPTSTHDDDDDDLPF